MAEVEKIFEQLGSMSVLELLENGVDSCHLLFTLL